PSRPAVGLPAAPDGWLAGPLDGVLVVPATGVSPSPPVAATSLSSGVGCSASSAPRAGDGSFQLTTGPSSYVSAPRSRSSSTLAGSGPPDTSNSLNSPGPIRTPGCAVQTTDRTASVISRSPDLTGLGSFSLRTSAVQPDSGFV